MPSGPPATASRAASSLTMLKTTSAAAAASRGVACHVRPRSISGWAFDAVRLLPCSWCPAASRRPAIGPPIAPRPTNPTALIAFPRSACVPWSSPRGSMASGQICDDVRERPAAARQERELVARVAARLGGAQVAHEIDDRRQLVGLEAEQPLIVAERERADGVGADLRERLRHPAVLGEHPGALWQRQQ